MTKEPLLVLAILPSVQPVVDSRLLSPHPFRCKWQGPQDGKRSSERPSGPFRSAVRTKLANIQSKIETEQRELAGYRLRWQSPPFDLREIIYLHGAARPDPHHRHREAPPDQQEAGSSLKPATDGDCCGCSGGDASTTLGLGRPSGDSSAPLGARAGGLASA